MSPWYTLDASSPTLFAIVVGSMFMVVLIRYFLVAGLFYWIFWKLEPRYAAARRIYRTLPRGKQLRNEIGHSIATTLIFAVFGAVMYALWQNGQTAIYTEVDRFGWWYLPASLLIYALIHETYFYWMHRLIHHPLLFKRVHAVHHQSIYPSPFASFSFNMSEAFLEALIVPLMVLVIPLHPIVLIVYLTLMTLSAVINHLGHEIYPPGTAGHWLGRYFIGATHHSQHHRHANCNYGLFFTFWDKWCETERGDYIAAFDRTIGRQPRSPRLPDSQQKTNTSTQPS